MREGQADLDYSAHACTNDPPSGISSGPRMDLQCRPSVQVCVPTATVTQDTLSLVKSMCLVGFCTSSSQWLSDVDSDDGQLASRIAPAYRRETLTTNL